MEKKVGSSSLGDRSVFYSKSGQGSNPRYQFTLHAALTLKLRIEFPFERDRERQRDLEKDINRKSQTEIESDFLNFHGGHLLRGSGTPNVDKKEKDQRDMAYSTET